jgi:ABC-type glutathione transport system ATPase component
MMILTVGKGVGMKNNNIIEISNLSFAYSKMDTGHLSQDKNQNILKNISINIKRKSIVGIAGKSGCGKTTLGKIITNYFKYSSLNPQKSGDIVYINQSGKKFNIESNDFENEFEISPIQMIFQEPKTSLNMKMNLKKQLCEAISLKNNKINERDMNELVQKLSSELYIEDLLDKKPENISGGQRRRFGIAKILSLEPDLILADEPVASLDVSIKHEILEVLYKLREKGITLIMISHDISLLENYADTIFIMDDGEIVEEWNPKTTKVPSMEKAQELVADSNFVNQILNKLN